MKEEATEMSIASAQAQQAPTHVLPAWFETLQDNLFLSFLILADMYILGTLSVTGWVSNLEDPFSWGWYHFIGVVVLFLAGAMMAGVSVRISVQTAPSFQEGMPL